MIGIPRFTRDDRGATLVEFALALPVLLLVLVACLDFARALNAYVTVANASREGAYYATIHPGADPDTIRDEVRARVSPLDASALLVTATYDSGSGPQAWPVGGVPQSAPLPAPVVVRVSTTYQWRASTWIVGSFFGAAGSRTFGSSSAMEVMR
ncbi:MAG TPA: TadE/TadG family type IV pilus assembly protein [Methylomirabilota bacterium]|nr:TadE/TadG family type IV pilus assembly protein [Methylomirabilota bacterium]